MMPQRLLAVFAHPDDESLLAGGTLAACANAGIDVALVCVTHGELGPIAHPSLATRDTLGAVRENELRSAGRILGIRQIVCLDYPDGSLRWMDVAALQTNLARHMRKLSPDVVMTFGAEGLYWHPDHIAVHDATVAAADQLRGKGGPRWIVHATWPLGLMSRLASAMTARDAAPDVWGLEPAAFGAPADTITATLDVVEFLPVKLRALRAHRSQLTSSHLFSLLPDDLAREHLSHEYFHASDSAGAWLATLTSQQKVAAHDTRG